MGVHLNPSFFMKYGIRTPPGSEEFCNRLNGSGKIWTRANDRLEQTSKSSFGTPHFISYGINEMKHNHAIISFVQIEFQAEKSYLPATWIYEMK
jgi:hypothetical protein